MWSSCPQPETGDYFQSQLGGGKANSPGFGGANQGKVPQLMRNRSKPTLGNPLGLSGMYDPSYCHSDDLGKAYVGPSDHGSCPKPICAPACFGQKCAPLSYPNDVNDPVWRAKYGYKNNSMSEWDINCSDPPLFKNDSSGPAPIPPITTPGPVTPVQPPVDVPQSKTQTQILKNTVGSYMQSGIGESSGSLPVLLIAIGVLMVIIAVALSKKKLL